VQTLLWQDCHCRVKLGAGLPVHVPFVDVTVCPTWGKPPTAGRDVLTGGAGETVTVAVGAEEAAVDPPALVAVTVAASVVSTSLLVTVCVLLVAPGRSVQPAPLELQRRHW